MNNHFQLVSSRHKKSLNFYKWTSFFFLFLALISSSVLVYQQWIKKTQLQELREQVQKQYNLQETHLVSVAKLVNNPKIHSFFADLLRNYAEKFAKNKKINISHLPLKFAGFYYDKNTSEGYNEMGHCFPNQGKEIKIELNRLYLLNKFGHDQYFTNNPQDGDYSYLDISFNKMIETCSHELAHYLQLVQHGKSSCESDRMLNNGKYNKELAQEHEKWTKEIYGMIKNLEYFKWERRWNYIQ